MFHIRSTCLRQFDIKITDILHLSLDKILVISMFYDVNYKR